MAAAPLELLVCYEPFGIEHRVGAERVRPGWVWHGASGWTVTPAKSRPSAPSAAATKRPVTPKQTPAEEGGKARGATVKRPAKRKASQLAEAGAAAAATAAAAGATEGTIWPGGSSWMPSTLGWGTRCAACGRGPGGALLGGRRCAPSLATHHARRRPPHAVLLLSRDCSCSVETALRSPQETQRVRLRQVSLASLRLPRLHRCVRDLHAAASYARRAGDRRPPAASPRCGG